MINLAAAMGIVFFTICLAVVIWHSSRVGRLTLLDWAVLGMGGVYGLGWSLVLWVTSSGRNPIWERWLLQDNGPYLLHTALALVLLGSISAGWLSVSSMRFVKRTKPPTYTYSKGWPRVVVALWALLMMSLMAQWLYSRAYGGFLGVLEYSSAIRSATIPVKNPFSFLHPFGGIALIASFGFYGLILSGSRRAAVWIGFVVSLIFSIYILRSWLGRVAFVSYILTFMLATMMARRSSPLVVLGRGALIFSGIMLGSYYVSKWLYPGVFDNVLVFAARELSFPFVDFLAQFSSENLQFRWFRDLVVAPIYLLPSSLWVRWIDEVSQVNTALVMGAPKGQQGVTGGMPVDLLTLGLMQASAVGVPVVGACFGGVLRVIQSVLDRIPDQGLRSVLASHVAMKIAVLAVFYAQPALVVSSNFALLVSALVIGVSFKMSRRKTFIENARTER